MRLCALLLALAVALAAGVAVAGAAPGAALPEDYWKQPLSPQGEAPSEWDAIERSLDPKACGECHADQYEEWRTSFHAGAFSPGLVGQLMTSFANNPGSCMQCHAPLAEQKQAFEEALGAGKAHLPEAQGLAAAGNSCAGCHLRENRRFGPPQGETGETGQSDPDAPHDGVFRTPDFEKSEFCNACHQFPPSWGAVNGKPLENTYNEWKASPQAAKGIDCQSCHMPERKHLWRGIHDPEMVASGLTPDFRAEAEKARFTLTNTGVGHAFPTYVTPKAVMRAVALDEAGNPVPGTEVSQVIRRAVSFAGGRWVESFDSRLLPGRSAVLELEWGKAERARMWLDVYPDDYYDHQVYDGLLVSYQGEAKRLIARADAAARDSRFRLFETEVKRP